ncbi:MAG: DUF4157 domain-containing protein [Cytophagales bacterium]|nr:DUF4157 domain-containing protein [Cytophagales bacterium]
MSRTYDNEKKPSQSTFSFKPTASFLQTRGFAPIQTDLDEDAAPRPSGYTENFLEKIINQRSTESSDTPVQAKPMNRLRRPLQDKRVSMIQAKLSIGEPNDKYEQEADATASKVVQQINSPTQDKSVQREAAMEEEDELQMKSLVQKSGNLDGGEASTDLESSIQSARGSGQSLDPNLQAKMGQAMGADFSGVKVHTDSQSDQLNKSIQAKAFTTGQDVFFRQGAYEPRSRGGQELIAHELTHVVQQNSGAVQRLVQREEYLDQRGVGKDYTGVNDETTVPRPGLLGAIGQKVALLKQLHQEYTDLQNDMGTGQATLNQVKEKFKERAEAHEFLRLQDVNVDIQGNMAPNALTGRLVKYDNTPQEQQKTLVTISGGKLKRDNGSPVDTSGSVTFHTGKGWEIFVMSPTGELHMASHKIGKYHHSSLLGGGPTSAAGTIMATGGTLVKMNNKSGHYQPKGAQMRQALHALIKAGVNLNFDLEITGEFTGKAEEYMKPISAGGQGGWNTFQSQASRRILHHFIATKGQAAVKKVFTDLGWIYTATSALITIQKPDTSMATHEEVRTELTKAFGESGPVKVERS